MTMVTTEFLDSLKRAAAEAEALEAGLHREMTAKIRKAERERAIAYRRYNLVRTLAESVADAENEDAAVARVLAALRDGLGWAHDSEARKEVLERFSPVAVAMFKAISPNEKGEEGEKPAANPIEALRTFEEWYAQSHDQQFWGLFDTYLPETPRVDF